MGEWLPGPKCWEMHDCLGLGALEGVSLPVRSVAPEQKLVSRACNREGTSVPQDHLAIPLLPGA